MINHCFSIFQCKASEKLRDIDSVAVTRTIDGLFRIELGNVVIACDADYSADHSLRERTFSLAEAKSTVSQSNVKDKNPS